MEKCAMCGREAAFGFFAPWGYEGLNLCVCRDNCCDRLEEFFRGVKHATYISVVNDAGPWGGWKASCRRCGTEYRKSHSASSWPDVCGGELLDDAKALSLRELMPFTEGGEIDEIVRLIRDGLEKIERQKKEEEEQSRSLEQYKRWIQRNVRGACAALEVVATDGGDFANLASVAVSGDCRDDRREAAASILQAHGKEDKWAGSATGYNRCRIEAARCLGYKPIR